MRSVDYVDKRIENFLKVFLKHLESMSSEDLKLMQETLKSTKETIDLTLSEEVSRNWNEIVDGEYLFDRLQKQVEKAFIFIR